MMALLSPGSSGLDDSAAAASFLLSLGLPASSLVTTGAVVFAAFEVGGAAGETGVAAGATGAVAAAELVAEFGTDEATWFGSVDNSGAAADVAAGASGTGAFAGLITGGGICCGCACATPARASTRSICGSAISRNPGS